jgi:tRNA threonylcarbamoyladenosine modification (KEOPS) complex  Pcc1 subunit
MKIQFDDKSFIHMYKSDSGDKIVIVIQAKDYNNPLKKITNAVELTEEEFKNLISDINCE